MRILLFVCLLWNLASLAITEDAVSFTSVSYAQKENQNFRIKDQTFCSAQTSRVVLTYVTNETSEYHIKHLFINTQNPLVMGFSVA